MIDTELFSARVGHEQSAEMVGGLAVTRRDPAPVDVEGRRGTCVAQPVGHRAEIDSDREEFGGDEMAKVMNANVPEPDGGTEPAPSLCHHLGSPRPLTAGIAGEDQFGHTEFPPILYGRSGGVVICAP